MTNPMQRVAVIGAGAAGLCALRHLTSRSDEFQFVAFEQSEQIGGTWVYTNQTGKDKNGLPIHSSMYKNLRTNIPKVAMGFPDFTFNTDPPSFCCHQDVLEYLKSYADNFGLYKHIKFQTRVQLIHPLGKRNAYGNTVWEITYSPAGAPNDTCVEEFDAVIVCVGHFSLPLIPDIPNLARFEGSVIHSHDYRVPESYEGQTVVCLGASFSGQDISIDICPHAKKVFLSHNKPRLTTALPDNLHQTLGIKDVGKRTVVFNDGAEESVDAIILCTGYRYSYPFMSEESHLTVDDGRVTPLYKHVVHTEFPNLSFIGICTNVCPFLQFDCQVRFVLAYLDQSMKLPSKEDMDRDIEDDFRRRILEGLPPRYAHLLGPRQWKYNDCLAFAANYDPIPNSKAIASLFYDITQAREKNLLTYKNINYDIISPDTFRVRDCRNSLVEI